MSTCLVMLRRYFLSIYTKILLFLSKIMSKIYMNACFYARKKPVMIKILIFSDPPWFTSSYTYLASCLNRGFKTFATFSIIFLYFTLEIFLWKLVISRINFKLKNCGISSRFSLGNHAAIFCAPVLVCVRNNNNTQYNNIFLSMFQEH